MKLLDSLMYDVPIVLTTRTDGAMTQGLFLSSELLEQATLFSIGVSLNDACLLAVFPPRRSDSEYSPL